MALIRRLVHLTCCTVFLLFTQFANANGVVVECSESANSALSAELKALVSEIAETTEIEVRRLLPDLPEEILLSVTTGPNVIPEIGIGASSLAPGHIEFVVNPGHPDGAEAIVRANLRSTLFHEMHHLTRGWVISGGEPVTSFMDAVVGEGMATVFEKEFAGSNPLWGNYSDEASEWVVAREPIDCTHRNTEIPRLIHVS